MNPLDQSGWLEIFANGGRIDHFSEGIIRDVKLDIGKEQKSEHEMRESVANPYIDQPQKAIHVATGHHSRGVMLYRAKSVLESISRSITERNKLLVDLGCGFGWHWVDMARLYPSVKFLLVDFSISNLLVCRSIMPFKDYPNVLCFHADISSLPVRGGVSDFCWSVQVIQHLPEEKRKAAFEEIKRIQKPGAGSYVAWVRPVPLIRLVYSLLGRKYHVKGVMRDGMFLQCFDDEIEADLKSFLRNTIFNIPRRYSILSSKSASEWIGSVPGYDDR